MRKNLVIIPTYNEAENIEQMIAAIMQLKQPFDLLVIDDNSPDGTANLTKALLSIHKDRLFLIVRPTKEGLGPAYLEAFRWALDHDYDYIFEMDAS